MFACASLPFGLFYDVSEYLLTEFGRHLELIGFTPRRYLVLHNGESFILCGSACLKQTWQANSKGRFRIAAFSSPISPIPPQFRIHAAGSSLKQLQQHGIASRMPLL
mmetsp:Transcript_86962/g.136213  ORF Transcript_86962/g.136213 Transcript_86962/m.136213 type:complete len:107 (+) Transcript_86962:1226-1546(+)